MNDLQLTIYANVNGSGGSAEFFGELTTFQLKDVFTSQNTGPHEEAQSKSFRGITSAPCLLESDYFILNTICS